MKTFLLITPLILALAATSCTKSNQDGIADNPPTSDPYADPYGVPQDPIANAKPKPKVKTYNGGSSYQTPNIPHEPLPDTNTAYTPPSYSGQSYGAPSSGGYNPPAYGNPSGSVQSSNQLPQYGGSTNSTYNPPISGTPQVATVPHTIQKGDTLWGLSKQYGTTVSNIKAANGMVNDKILTGTTIQIPSAR